MTITDIVVLFLLGMGSILAVAQDPDDKVYGKSVTVDGTKQLDI